MNNTLFPGRSGQVRSGRPAAPRRLLTALLATLLLAAAGCGGDGGEGGGGGGGQEAYDVTLIQGVAGDEFYISMACGAQAAAQELGVNLDVQGAEKWEASLQTPIVNAVAAEQPDAVLIAPVDTQALIAPMRQLKEAGAVVVEVDTNVEDDSIAVSTIASDNLEGGRTAAKALAEQIGERGKVLVVGQQPGISTTDQRQQGFEEELANHPDIDSIGVQYSENDPAKAASIVTSTLAAHPDLAGIFAVNVFSGEGAATGVQNAGAQDKVKLVAFDATPGQVEALEAGAIQALVVQKPLEIGRMGVEQAVAALKGEEVKREISTDFVIATKDNVNDPEVNRYLYKGDC